MAFQFPFKFSGSSADAAIAARTQPSKMMEYDQPLIAAFIGTLLGLVSAYVGGWVDVLLMPMARCWASRPHKACNR